MLSIPLHQNFRPPPFILCREPLQIPSCGHILYHTGATIYYTTNGSTPSASSSIYSLPIGVSSNTIIKTYAAKAGMTNSDLKSAEYKIAPRISAPTFSCHMGSLLSTQTVIINCATPGVTIYYTIDGSYPTTGSSIYNGPITVAKSTVIRTYAVKIGMSSSELRSGTYIISPKVSMPVITPVSGAMEATQPITMSCSTVGATIYYTKDGSTPTTSSLIYTTPITVSVTTTIKALR